jgi:hypothetical protein
MRRQQLSEAQITALLDPPTDQRELGRHYTLFAADLAAIRRCRGDCNRLGRALMLCYLRYPGRPLKAGERPRRPLACSRSARPRPRRRSHTLSRRRSSRSSRNHRPGRKRRVIARDPAPPPGRPPPAQSRRRAGAGPRSPRRGFFASVRLTPIARPWAAGTSGASSWIRQPRGMPPPNRLSRSA